jgi:hypothetical protein
LNTDLKSLVKEVALVQKRANVDIEAASWQTRPSLQNMKMEALEQLAKLKEQYTRKVRSNTLGVFVFGGQPRVEAFCKIADEEAGVMQVNGNDLYRRLAARIEPNMGASREFGPTQLQGLIEGLRDINQEMGVRTMRMPNLQAINAPKDVQELTTYIRKLVQGVVGDDLLRMYVDQKINQMAIDTEFSGNILPVAVAGIEKEEAVALASLFSNSVSVEVGTSEGGEVNKEYVLNQLKNLKSKFKGNTNNQ